MFSILGNSTPNTSNAAVVSFDGDSLEFISAATITDMSMKIAINELVLDLKYYDIWNHCTAIYPFVGGNATSHKFNLKNPFDTNAAYRLGFSGAGWTHSSTGARPNGSTDYANTFFVPSGLTYTNNHICYYTRTITANSSTETTMGAGFDNAGTQWFVLFSRRSGNNAGYDSSTNNRATFTNTNGSGFYVGKSTSTTGKIYKNGMEMGTKAMSSRSFPNTTITLGAINTIGSGIQFFSTKEFSYSSFGLGITDQQVYYYNLIIQKFQLLLGRNV